VEDKQPRHQRNDSKDTSVLPESQSLGNVDIGLMVGNNVPPSSRASALLATASAIALASIKKSILSVGAKVEHCSLTTNSSYDVKFLLEGNLAAVLRHLHPLRPSAREQPGIDGHIAPIIVICNHQPSADRLRKIWMKHELQPYVVMEYIALPCGPRQLNQAISTVLSLSQRRAEAAMDRPLPTTELSNIPEHDQILQHVDLPRAIEMPVIVSPEQLPLSDAGSLSSQLSPVTPIDQSDIPLVHRSAPPASSSRVPTLLLVDDNEINLWLLVAFAKKLKYSYITAVDGLCAVEAFKEAHRRHTSGEQRDEAAIATNSHDNVDAARLGGGVPNVILMDINMPVMDEYEAVQQIRAYEKRQHMVASTVIAVPAPAVRGRAGRGFWRRLRHISEQPAQARGLEQANC
jgi:CheY-like chemotaxis protein